MFDLSTILRPNIKKMKPYSSARDEYQGNTGDMIFLDANENPNENGVNRYPDPQQNKLKEVIAKKKNLSEAQILLGNGSDEVLDLIFRAFCEPGSDRVIILPPTYGMYKVLAAINNVAIDEVPLNDNFQPNDQAILKQVKPNTKLLFICSPNNPTGNSFSQNQLTTLLMKFNGIVVIDEAYIDFSIAGTYLSELKNYPNLIVTQTMSKAYGMAGIRLGLCYASKEIIEVLNRIKPPYNINELTQQRALLALENEKETRNQIAKIIASREALSEDLQNISFVKRVYPSDANFLLVEVDDANFRYAQLIEQRIVVRNRTNQLLCKNCLRFTVGTPTENSFLIKTLKKLNHDK